MASTLTKVWKAVETLEQREQLIAGMTAIRQSPRTQWSLREFADQYLGNQLTPLFQRAAPNADGYNSEFQFSRDIFDAAVQFRVFELDNHVVVSTPFAEVGRSVVTSDPLPPDANAIGANQAEPRRRRLTVEGNIIDERLRRTRG